MSEVICISGHIASGKTTFARSLARQIVGGSCFRSFGDVVRAEACTRGEDPDQRPVLQAIGLELTNDWPHFVSLLLNGTSSERPIIVDGVRHPQALTEIRRQAASDLTSIFVTIPDDIMHVRLKERGENPEVLAHAVEAETMAVRGMADYEVVGCVDSEWNGRFVASLIQDVGRF